MIYFLWRAPICAAQLQQPHFMLMYIYCILCWTHGRMLQLMYCTLGYTLSLVAVIYTYQRATGGRSRGRKDCTVHLRLLSSRCHDRKSQLHDAWLLLFHPHLFFFQSLSFSQWITDCLPPAHIPLLQGFNPSRFYSQLCLCYREALKVESAL